MNQLYIPLQNVTVTTTPTLQNIGIDSQCNITVKNSTGDNLIISTTDSMAQLKSFTVYAGNSTIIKKTNAYQVSFKAETSSTIFSAVISWPDEVDPSSLTVAGTINTDIGQRTNTLTGTNPVTGVNTPNSSGKITSNSQLTVPSSVKWKIIAVHMTLLAGAAGAVAWVYVNRSNDNFPTNPSAPPSFEAGEQLAYFNNAALPSGDNAYASGSVATGNGTGFANYTTQNWTDYPELYPGDIIAINFIAGTGSAMIWYAIIPL